MTETKKQEWNSNLAFMMAMIGSAVGLGNIWRFPNVLYSNGGGSFMIPYIVSLFLTWNFICISGICCRIQVQKIIGKNIILS